MLASRVGVGDWTWGCREELVQPGHLSILASAAKPMSLSAWERTLPFFLAWLGLVLAGCGSLLPLKSETSTSSHLPYMDSGSTSQSSGTGGVKSIFASARLSAPAQPSHKRLWKPNLSVLPFAEIDSNRVIVRNVRDTVYRTESDCDVRHIDMVVPLDSLQTVDFIVVPFRNAPSLAHTMISFGLSSGQHIAFSVEARLEIDESYSPIDGALKRYELMWVVATERDAIGLRTTIRGDDVFLYRTRAQPEQARQVFLAAVARVNEIHRSPEFYDTLRNNCTTNIVNMINQLRPGTIQEDIRLLLPGHSDRMLYDQGLIIANGSFEGMRQASRINMAAHVHFGSADFSRAIRGHQYH